MLSARIDLVEREAENLKARVQALENEVRTLEGERQWWRRCHLKWGPIFRLWRDWGNE